MQKKLITIITMLCIATYTFAQSTIQKGFYINPELSVGITSVYQIYDTYNMLSPNINVGYIWDKGKYRHNVSLDKLAGGFGGSFSSFTAGIKYSFDYKIYTKNKLSLYIAPYAKTGIFYFKNRTTDYRNSYINNYLSFGTTPKVELKLRHNIDFLFSLPIHFGSFYHTSSTNTLTTTPPIHSSISGFDIKPSISSSLGIRINLFNKKEKKKPTTNY